MATKTKTLRNGAILPSVHLGTWLTEEAKTAEVVQWALEIGYRGIDCAEWYENEHGCGLGISRFLKANPNVNRSEIFYTTKLKDNVGYEETKAAIQRSLKECGLEYIDLYLMHAPHGGPKVRADCWKAIIEAVESGKVKSAGVSNYGIRHLEEFFAQTPDHVPMVNQIELNPFNQQNHIVDFCKKNNIQLQAFTPLSNARKLDHEVPISIAKSYGKSPAQVMIRWSLQKGYVPLPKTITKSRLEENFNGNFDWELKAEDMQKLDALDEHFVNDWDPTEEP